MNQGTVSRLEKACPLVDLALLRTFVAVVDGGGIARAADLVGRSQPAVSLQIRRLEESVGAELFRRTGRAVELTEPGHVLLTYARRALEMNAEMMAAVSRSDLSGTIRIGISQDFANRWLTAALARFGRAHPNVVVQARADRNSSLKEALARNQVDLALLFSEFPGEDGRHIGSVPVVWISGPDMLHPQSNTVPIVAFDPPCFFRSLAVSALEERGMNWRLAFSSSSLACQWSAVEAGFGYSVRTPIGVRGPLKVMADDQDLPPLGSVDLVLRRADDARSALVDHMEGILMDAVREHLASVLIAPARHDRPGTSRSASGPR